MKRILLILFVGISYGFMDTFMRNQSVEILIILSRGFFSTLLVSGGFIGALVNKGETVKNSILKCNKTALTFFIAYFIGGMLFKMIY